MKHLQQSLIGKGKLINYTEVSQKQGIRTKGRVSSLTTSHVLFKEISLINNQDTSHMTKPGDVFR